MFKTKRVYDPPGKTDGYRVLVDRLWPRGLSKAKAKIDLWLREVAPSDALRKWFRHDPGKWGEFQRRYRAELNDTPAAVKALKRLEQEHGTVMLLYAAADQQHNNAMVLAGMLHSRR